MTSSQNPTASNHAGDPCPANDLPVSLPGHWTTQEGWGLAAEYANWTRGALTHGDLSDFEIANAVFMADRRDLDLIVWQTAAKERIRWLSVQLALARTALGPPK